MRLSSSLLVTALAAAGCLAAPQVTLGNTTVIGKEDFIARQEFFGGIPFAEPPLGNLRLKPPVLKTYLDTESFDASGYGIPCLQPSSDLITNSSEDCLTINILRPSNLPLDTQVPVLVWVYGGGFQGGASSIRFFKGNHIVAQSVARGTPLIYVSFNYRLGPLGFPQGDEAASRGALNLGIKDEIAALEWVQQNIGAFGGDRSKVTVFGESAGAIMTSILLLNPSFDQLARGVILESGSPASSINALPSRRQANWDKFVSGVSSCDSSQPGNTFDCLENADQSEIWNGLMAALREPTELFSFGPTIDGPGGVYPDLPSQVFSSGNFARIPFIAGTNLDEGTGFTPKEINSEQQIHDLIIANFTPPFVQGSELEEATQTLLQLYPDIPAEGSPYFTGNETFGLSSQFKRTAAIQGDIAFLSQRRFLQKTAARADVKNWGYVFTQPQPPLSIDIRYLGVLHGAEIPSVFGIDLFLPWESSRKLSKWMIDYWVSFATSLTPNDGVGEERPVWQAYTEQNGQIIQLNGDNTTMIADTFHKEKIDYINSIPTVFFHRRDGTGVGN